jgi:hypothetical protein
MQVRVRYTVAYECVLDISNTSPDEMGDILSDIDIPEGGKHNSSYVSQTFEVVKIEQVENI